ncbi:MAG: hypothetical protein HC897_20540 [Thermoanaerobaculia bacterium]|nr:hypothetical protein [Thermoanaerobaculia bacterium]
MAARVFGQKPQRGFENVDGLGVAVLADQLDRLVDRRPPHPGEVAELLVAQDRPFVELHPALEITQVADHVGSALGEEDAGALAAVVVGDLETDGERLLRALELTEDALCGGQNPQRFGGQLGVAEPRRGADQLFDLAERGLGAFVTQVVEALDLGAQAGGFGFGGWGVVGAFKPGAGFFDHRLGLGG